MAVETSHEDDRHSKYGTSGTDTASPNAAETGDIEQYGVWVKAGPVDIGDEEEKPEEFQMEDLEPESADGALTQEEEELLGSLETEEDGTPDLSVDTFDMDDLPEIEENEPQDELFSEPVFSTEDQDTINEDQQYLDQEDGKSLDDIGGFDLDLADSHEEEESMEIPEESASILQKIEKDLLSIKDELTALKMEISSLRSTGTKLDSDEQKDEAESGFFEEDEDETIALTGDELDNILNTADITEQTGQSTASPEDADLLIEDDTEQAIIDRDDILFDDAPPATAEAPDISFDDMSDELTIDDSFADDASVAEASISDLSLEEVETANEEEALLDLPQEEEIILDDIPGTDDLNLDDLTAAGDDLNLDDLSPAGDDLNLDDMSAAGEELQLETGDETPADDMTFELDEELQLSPSEQEDLEASQDLLADENLIDLGTDEETDLDEIELAEMESEAAGADIGSPVESAEQSVDEAFDLTDDTLELPEADSFGDMGNDSAEPALPGANEDLPADLKSEIRAILKYMDQLLESLPEDKIEEFANSEYFDVYKRLFEELGLAT
ncbi:MAG TPA: hypothetical protein VMW69_15830 [Spirochaetia bacterium]|nr:hypothetical protein [Spirochaetia bacterium]